MKRYAVSCFSDMFLSPISSIQLDEEGLKEKRKQRLLKAGWEARARARKEKMREREEKEAEERREAEERERDLDGWADKLRREHEVRTALFLIGSLALVLLLTSALALGDDESYEGSLPAESGAIGSKERCGASSYEEYCEPSS